MNEFFKAHPLLDSLILLSGCLWFLYKYFRTRDLQYVFPVLVILSVQMARWPLFLDYRISLGTIALICIGFLCYEKVSKRKLPRRLYIICFSCIGAFFLVRLALGI